MTIEETIESLKKLKSFHNGSYGTFIDMAIKALEQQPCEDCISRKAVINTIFYKADNNSDVVLSTDLMDRIKHLPSVTPKPKMGRWIVIREEYEFMSGIVNEPRGCKCSNCNKVVRFKSDFCPNCGADMRGERE